MAAHEQERFTTQVAKAPWSGEASAKPQAINSRLLNRLAVSSFRLAVTDAMIRFIWVASAALSCGSAALGAGEAEPPKPASHTLRELEGWTVRVDDRLLAPPQETLGARALRFLEAKLSDIKVVMATEPLARLQTVTLVLDLNHGALRSMQYHPSAGWLQANGYATNLARCVHIPVAADLPTPRNVTEQPWVILHELAHAYHDQVLGFDEPRVRKCYEEFQRSGRGERALRYDGVRARHYALTDAKEFFAEMSEAYFGLNDFFPFNRAELMTAEPEVFELMQAIWGPVGGDPRRGTRALGEAQPPPATASPPNSTAR